MRLFNLNLSFQNTDFIYDELLNKLWDTLGGKPGNLTTIQMNDSDKAANNFHRRKKIT